MIDKNTICIGIDPGKDGAMAILYPDGAVLTVPFDPKAYLDALDDVLCDSRGAAAAVERVGARPGQGVTSMFSFGENFGWIQGVLDAMFVPYRFVTPQKWKRFFGLSFPKGTDKSVIKAASVEKASGLYPDVDLRRTPRCKKPHDGVAEALLIATYCRDSEVAG